VSRGARAARTLHRYTAGLEVWRRMANSTDPAYRRTAVGAQRDSIRQALRTQIGALASSLENPIDHKRGATIEVKV